MAQRCPRQAGWGQGESLYLSSFPSCLEDAHSSSAAAHLWCWAAFLPEVPKPFWCCVPLLHLPTHMLHLSPPSSKAHCLLAVGIVPAPVFPHRLLPVSLLCSLSWLGTKVHLHVYFWLLSLKSSRVGPLCIFMSRRKAYHSTWNTGAFNREFLSE